MAWAALAALTALTACDPAATRDVRGERENRRYQAAMADYKAGRVDAAASGFEAAAREDPSNAEARFQLGCLLHDAKKDAAGAFCAYREYLMQRPDGDKAALAKQRLDVCERELAAMLAERHKLVADPAVAEAQEALRKEAKEARARVAQLEKELASAKASMEALAAERTRLLAAVRGEDETTVASKGPDVKEVKDLLDLLEEENENTNHVAIADDAAALRREDLAESATGPSLLPPRATGDVVKVEKKTDEKAAVRPATYEVQEGDTLYKIAIRFYGSIRAWRMIRDANKTLISTDGRVQAGQTIRLP